MQIFNPFSKQAEPVGEVVVSKGGFDSGDIDVVQSDFRNKLGQLKGFSENEWIYAAANKKASVVSTIPLVLYRKEVIDGKVRYFEIGESPILDHLNKPSPFFSKQDIFYLVSVYLDLVGEAFVYADPDNNELTPLYPHKVKIVKDSKDFIKHYEYDVNGDSKNVKKFAPESVIHWRRPNPLNYYEGMSPIAPAANVADADVAAQKSNRLLFENGGFADFIIRIKDKVTDDVYNRFKSGLKKRFSGLKNARKWGVTQLDFDVEHFHRDTKDMDFEKLGNNARKRILAVLETPKFAIGDSDDVNRASALQAEIQYKTDTIIPRIEFIVDKLNLDYLEVLAKRLKIDAKNLEIGYVDPRPVDPETEIKQQEADLKKWETLSRIGAVSPNEVRAAYGLEPINGGDRPLVQFSLVPLGEGAASVPADEGRSVKKNVLKVANEEKVVSAFLKRFDKNEAKVLKTVNPIFESQRAEVLRNIAKEVKKLDQGDLNIDKDASKKALTEKLAPVFLGIMQEEGASALLEIGSESPFQLDNPAVRAALKKQTQRFAKEVTDTTYDSLKNQLEEGIKAGEGAEELSKRVNKVFDFATKTRARTIARTETGAASSVAHEQAYRQAGVEKKRWITTEDDRTREAHARADGQVRNMNDKFSVGGEELDYPSDRFHGSAANVINCRCRMIAEIE